MLGSHQINWLMHGDICKLLLMGDMWTKLERLKENQFMKRLSRKHAIAPLECCFSLVASAEAYNG